MSKEIKVYIDQGDRILTSKIGTWKQSEVLNFDIEMLDGEAYNLAMIEQVKSEIEFLLQHSDDYIVHNHDGLKIPVNCFIQEAREIIPEDAAV